MRFSRACKSYEDWAVPQRQTAERLKELEEVSGTVLDLGCGTGFLSEGFQKVVGVDIAMGMVRVYRDRFGRVVLGDAHDLPFKNKSFDAVLSNFTLHWTQIERSIPEAMRVCRGLFICALPVEGSLPQLGYPFPSVSHIRTLLESKGRIRKFFLEDVLVPFQGWDLIKFFHYTGSSYNPLLKGVIISRKKMENMINMIDSPVFRVLFFSHEVRE
ncbi:MAG: methyltransferase domain-containing protein [Aquificaceae bacterium]|nr:methyltransferase domain-containing protein [Aquificaceae bacterium]MCX7989284.1 methyltransferase domain-containing protein [Aquificaceae bacterium]MDW8294983.1 methyltransferase domain-containing protein [Aquificaceae bacterium]